MTTDLKLPTDLLARLPQTIVDLLEDAPARALDVALRWAWLEGYGDRLAEERAALKAWNPVNSKVNSMSEVKTGASEGS